MAYFPPSELIINPNGSIYHLHLHPEQLADTVITVGDPDRVSDVTQYFDRITDRVQHREFVTHTGEIGSKRLTVISTGIGTDNIDIVLNELDALANIDFTTRSTKSTLRSLDIVRIGTSGSLQTDLPLDTILASAYAFGSDALGESYSDIQANLFDGLANNEKSSLFKHQTNSEITIPFAYGAFADTTLLNKIAFDLPHGFTLTAPGFYAPQGRFLRAKGHRSHFVQELAAWRFQNYRLTNLEMETAGIYALAKILGHNALSINALLANRLTNQFSSQAAKTVDTAIRLVLARI